MPKKKIHSEEKIFTAGDFAQFFSARVLRLQKMPNERILFSVREWFHEN
jgi:hypothetical protein